MSTQEKQKLKKGLALLSKEERSRIARLGGLARQKVGDGNRWQEGTERPKIDGACGGKKSRPKKKRGL